jgi:hypothetical protein
MSQANKPGAIVRAAQNALERRVQSSHEEMVLQQSNFLAKAITWALIATTDLTLRDVALTQDRYGPQLSGHVSNGSARRLGTLTLTVTYRQCAPDGACRTLGTETPRLFLALPPGQTGGFSTLLTQGAFMALPGIAWDCTIAAAQTDF